MVLPVFVPFVMGAKIIFEAAGPVLMAVAIGHRNEKPHHGGNHTADANEIRHNAEQAKRYRAERRAQCEKMIRRSEERQMQCRKGGDRRVARRKHDRTRRIVLRARQANRRKMVTHQFNPDLPLTIAENEANRFDIQPVWIK